MDRAEAALLVAEKAVSEIKRLEEKVAAMEEALKRAFSFVIDEGGNLSMVGSDGSLKSLGRVRGADGRSVDPLEVERMVAAKVAELPPAPAGRDGADGVGFDDLRVEYDGERKLSLVFERGDVVKEAVLDLPIVIDRGVYRDGTTYARGDSVTCGGSIWIAQSETSERPDAGSKDWRLAVKKGRDGRNGDRGEKGDPGRPGKDLTRVGPDGSKF